MAATAFLMMPEGYPPGAVGLLICPASTTP